VHALDVETARGFAGAPFRLARLVNGLRPDIFYTVLVHANALGALTWPLLSPRPRFVQSLHTLQDKPAWHWTLQGLVAPFCDAMVVPAKPILDRIEANGFFPRGKVIPYGIDTERFAQPSEGLAKPVLPWGAGAKVIGYVGRFDPVKNLPVLLRAFALMKDRVEGGAHLALLGYGAQEAELRELSKSLHLAPRVHFLGASPHPELYYKHFACLALPSTAEGFGLILVEAMAAGTPVVAMRTAVIASIVRDGVDGVLLDPPPVPERLAVALQGVISGKKGVPPGPTGVPHGAPLGSLSSPAYATAEFSVGRMVERHREFFNNL
jgi:glycosyltransferase involved in cell wall biosynthesis